MKTPTNLARRRTKPPLVVTSHCNICAHETSHDVLYKKDRVGTIDVDGDSYGYTVWSSFIECRGCEATALHVETWAPDFHDEPHIEYFPPRVSRREPAFIDEIASCYRPILREIYAALHADSRALAAMGARLIVDTFIREKVGDQGAFSKGLDELTKEGYLGSIDREILEPAIDAGSAAAHRAHRPSARDLNAIMDIVESLLQKDVLLERAKALSVTTPQRPPRAKKKVQQGKSQ